MSTPFEKRKTQLNLLNIFRKKPAEPPIKPRAVSAENPVFIKCSECSEGISRTALAANLYVCPHCGFHFPISCGRRLDLVCDPDSFVAFEISEVVKDPLGFPGYPEKLEAAAAKTKIKEAATAGHALICGIPFVTAVLDSRFFMGSMGSYVGEIVTYSAEYALEHSLPLVIFSASGGARMQEGIISLMQMAKTSAAIRRLSDAGGLFVSYLTHPTTGGVSASFAGLGDIMLAEPGALIGFAGPRVIEQTIKQKLPDGFQRPEFITESGFLDMTVERADMKDTLVRLFKLHQKGGPARD